MDWYVVDKNYINYLTQFDSRVGYVEYGERLKLHVGILLTIGDYNYYVPISSAKPKHQRMSNSLDFHKLPLLQDVVILKCWKKNAVLIPVHNTTILIPTSPSTGEVFFLKNKIFSAR